jgi:hypothetical protein
MIYTSVADPGCLSRIPDPDFYPFRIPDPKPATKERGEKSFFVKPFFVGTNFTKLKIFFFFSAEEKNLGQFSKNYRTFYPKICHQVLKNMGLGSGIWDPRSGKKPIPDPAKKAPDPGSGSATLIYTSLYVMIYYILWVMVHQKQS